MTSVNMESENHWRRRGSKSRQNKHTHVLTVFSTGVSVRGGVLKFLMDLILHFTPLHLMEFLMKLVLGICLSFILHLFT